MPPARQGSPSGPRGRGTTPRNSRGVKGSTPRSGGGRPSSSPLGATSQNSAGQPHLRRGSTHTSLDDSSYQPPPETNEAQMAGPGRGGAGAGPRLVGKHRVV